MQIFQVLISLIAFLPLFLSSSVYKIQPEEFKPKFEVVACLLQHEDKLLFLHRQDTAAEGNLWGIPGGKIEKDETPEEAIVRELREETGFDISEQPVEYLGKVYVKYPTHDFVFHLVKAKIAEDTAAVKLSFREHKGFTWITAEDLQKLPLMPDELALLKPHLSALNCS